MLTLVGQVHRCSINQHSPCATCGQCSSGNHGLPSSTRSIEFASNKHCIRIINSTKMELYIAHSNSKYQCPYCSIKRSKINSITTSTGAPTGRA